VTFLRAVLPGRRSLNVLPEADVGVDLAGVLIMEQGCTEELPVPAPPTADGGWGTLLLFLPVVGPPSMAASEATLALCCGRGRRAVAARPPACLVSAESGERGTASFSAWRDGTTAEAMAVSDGGPRVCLLFRLVAGCPRWVANAPPSAARDPMLAVQRAVERWIDAGDDGPPLLAARLAHPFAFFAVGEHPQARRPAARRPALPHSRCRWRAGVDQAEVVAALDACSEPSQDVGAGLAALARASGGTGWWSRDGRRSVSTLQPPKGIPPAVTSAAKRLAGRSTASLATVGNGGGAAGAGGSGGGRDSGRRSSKRQCQ